jgi:hypothetical protein
VIIEVVLGVVDCDGCIQNTVICSPIYRYAKDLNYCTIHTDLAAPTPIRNLRSEKIASVYHQRREPID